jgi:hypothetical protein
MYRQACRSYALLGTTSAAIKAWSLACIAKPAAHTHSLVPRRQLPKPGSWHVSPTPAAHTHSLAPPRQLSKLWFLACMVFGMYRQRLQLMRTPWHPLISYLLVSHRRSSNCFETVVLLDLSLLKPQRSTFLFCFKLRISKLKTKYNIPIMFSASNFEAENKIDSALGQFSCKATRVHAHATAVGAHLPDARRLPRRLARSSERMHMGSNGGEERHEPSYKSIRSYAT